MQKHNRLDNSSHYHYDFFLYHAIFQRLEWRTSTDIWGWHGVSYRHTRCIVMPWWLWPTFKAKARVGTLLLPLIISNNKRFWSHIGWLLKSTTRYKNKSVCRVAWCLSWFIIHYNIFRSNDWYCKCYMCCSLWKCSINFRKNINIRRDDISLI